MGSLYDAGWRQGSILYASLPFDGVIVDDKGEVTADRSDHDCWVIATQNCDLSQTDLLAPEDTIELRPVFSHDPPRDRGIRSYK